MRENAQAAERALALQSCGERLVDLHVLPGRTQCKLAGVQNPRFVRAHFELFGELALVLRWIHVGIRMVVEQAEEAVETNVNGRWLHHFVGPRIKRDMTLGVRGTDVAVR